MRGWKSRNSAARYEPSVSGPDAVSRVPIPRPLPWLRPRALAPPLALPLPLLVPLSGITACGGDGNGGVT